MTGQGPERFTPEGISMPIYGVGPKRRRKSGNPLLGFVFLLLLAAAAWWVATAVFGVDVPALGEDALRAAGQLMAAARLALGV